MKMKKAFLIVELMVCGVVAFGAFDSVTSQDATKTGLEGFRTKVNANFAKLTGPIVTNISAQTATVAGTVTPQAGPTVTATAVVTPQAGPTVTATAANTPQMDTIAVTLSPQTVDVTNAAGGVSTVWTNATASFTGMTNATIVVTVANGAGLLTNATAAVTVANGAGLLTNVTVSMAGATTNVLKQTTTP